MTYGIAEVQQAYNLWKDGKKEEQSSLAVSFSSQNSSCPLVFFGLSTIQEFLGEKVFPDQVIAYLHSLLEVDGAFLFPDQFVKELSELLYDVKIKAPLEGSIIFPGEPVIKLEGNSLVLFFFKKLLSYYLPFQVQIATEVEKIVSLVSSGFVITKNLEEYSLNKGHLYTKAAFIGGAIACEDLFAASLYKIPLCFHSQKLSTIVLNIQEESFDKKLSLAENGANVFLTGGVTSSWLEEHLHYLSQIKGVILNLPDLLERQVVLKWHQFGPVDVLQRDFEIYRLSYKGLYCTDIVAGGEGVVRETIFGRSATQYQKEKLLVDYTKETEGLDTIKSRAKRSMRSLPCKYTGNSKNSYPVTILKKSHHHRSFH